MLYDKKFLKRVLIECIVCLAKLFKLQFQLFPLRYAMQSSEMKATYFIF